jgi:hypothetical protein
VADTDLPNPESTEHHPDELSALEREAQRQRELEAARKLAEVEKQAASRLRARNRIITAIGAIALIAAVVAVFFAYSANRNLGAAQDANTQAAQNLSAAQTANTQSAQNLNAANRNAATAEAASTEAAANLEEALRQTNLARARQLAAQAQQIIDRQPDQLPRAVLLAVESLRRHPESAGNQALGNGLDLLPIEAARLMHDGPVIAVAFSPDGKWVVSGSSDTTARVWDISASLREASLGDNAGAATGAEVARLTHDNDVNTVAFSPDGKWVISGSGDGTARVWLWRAEDLIDLACSRLTRNLTQAEWRQYLGDEPYRKTCENLPEGE